MAHRFLHRPRERELVFWLGAVDRQLKGHALAAVAAMQLFGPQIAAIYNQITF
jgi:hypothetical protein